jgi:hypothetical protein
MVTAPFVGEDWLSANEPSRFSREFKLEALRQRPARDFTQELRMLGILFGYGRITAMLQWPRLPGNQPQQHL